MFGLYFEHKWKFQRFGKIINRISGTLTNQRLSTTSVIHKVSY